MLNLGQTVEVAMPGHTEPLKGVVSGRSFCEPPVYDITLDRDNILNSIPAAYVEPLEKEELDKND